MKKNLTRHGLAHAVSKCLMAAALPLAALPGVLSAQTLQHRYSFVSDASDSVGNANGTIVAPTTGAPATIANGLSLPGSGGGFGTSGYVSLPAGMLVGNSSLTVECWVTQNQGNTWAEIWDFGSDNSHNFALIPFPQNNNGNMEVAFTPHGNEIDLQSASAFPNGVEQYVVVTYNNSTLVGDLYTNGVLDATTTFPDATYSPGSIGGAGGTTQNMLGNDVYGDAQFGGTIYEFRVWNGVVSQRYISASAIAGSGVLITNLTPTSATLTAGSSVLVTGTEQATVNVLLPQTGTNEVLATSDAINWTSGNPGVLAVNSQGLITGVGAGTTTVRATVGGITCTSGPITVTPFALAHRYSFVSDASDSVGGADGTIVAPNGGTDATIANGLSLPGGGGGGFSGYVSLPAGILAGTTSLTIECWLTQSQGNTWATPWDFANSGSQNFEFCPKPGNNGGNMEAAFTPNGNERDLQTSIPFPSGSEQYVVVTYNNFTLAGDLYYNGVLDATITLPNTGYAPGGIGGPGGTTQNSLGNDIYNDAQFQGTIYELRIWDGAVSPVYVAVSAAAGPSVIVSNLTPQSLSISVTTNMLGSGVQQAVVTGNFAAATNVTVTDGAVNWTSSNPSVLTVNSGGVITALNGGTATVSASVDGVSATSATITVATTAPIITQAPANTTVVLGESATFSVQALGGSLGYQWSYGGASIAGATNNTLTVTNVTYASAGTYTVTVVNGLGTISGSATLTVVQSILGHRYSFVSDASDSVGNANGTIVAPTTGAPATIANGLALPGSGGGFGTSGYVSLPSGILTNYTSLSVECWVTQNQGNGWAEIWDFGNNGSQNFALIPFPENNGGNMEVAFTPHGNEVDLQSASLFPNGVEQYVVVTYDNSSLVGNLYTNGILDATHTFPDTTYSPGSIGGAGGTTENMLGNDVYGDSQFAGTIFEFRIWNGVVSQRYIAASAVAGSGVLITNLTPTAATLTAGPNVIVTGTEQSTVTVQLAQTGTNELVATGDATNWTSANPAVLAVNSAGVITGVGPGTTTVSATVGGITCTSGPITTTPFGLEHRYSFVSDATDSVGGANGTIVAANGGAEATIDNGLSLPGSGGGFGTSGYVSLPSGILTDTTSLTIECWVTQNQGNGWAELWDFGNNGNQNFALIPFPLNNNGNMEVAFTPNGNDIYTASVSKFPTNVEQYVALTYNNFTLVANLYTNGVLDATQTYPNTSYSPGSIGGAGGTTQNMLGNDVYGDAQFSGTLYEFRIWNGAVSPVYIAISAAIGPDVVVTNTTPLVLSISAGTSMTAGQSQQATVTGTFPQAVSVPVTGGATNWTSSNPGVLTVNSSGLITAVGNGSATVSATVGGVTATSASITVGPNTVGITRSGSSLTLTWQNGILLQAPTVLGPWTTNTTAVSPFTFVPAASGNEFYRVQVNP